MSVFTRRAMRGTEAVGIPPVGGITHGEQLTKAMTGFSPLGVSSSNLDLVDTTDRVSNWPGNTWPTWIINTPYVYDNNPTNKGGVVPAGGMMIDGFMVSEGTYVVQFRDFSDGQIVVEGDVNGAYPPFAGLMLRGCKWRCASPNIGLITENGMSTGGKFWVHYCDLGGLGSQPADYCEIPLKISSAPAQSYRNYISYVTTGVQFVGLPGTNIIENYIERLTTFNTSGPHLNGMTFNGGDTCARVERNYIVAQTPEDNGSAKDVDQTDCVSFFQDFGFYPGNGVNDDATTGYRVIDNYVGGTGYCFYGGTGGQGSVTNMQFIGNKVTTAFWPNGGYWGPMTADPAWGSNGNVNTNNTWADGPSVGASAF